MAIRKNKKRIDPRYFLHETTIRDEIEEGFDSPEWASMVETKCCPSGRRPGVGYETSPRPMEQGRSGL